MKYWTPPIFYQKYKRGQLKNKTGFTISPEKQLMKMLFWRFPHFHFEKSLLNNDVLWYNGAATMCWNYFRKSIIMYVFSRNSHENLKTNLENKSIVILNGWKNIWFSFGSVTFWLTFYNWKSHILEDKSPKNHPKWLKITKASVAKKSEQLFDWLLTVKCLIIFHFGILALTVLQMRFLTIDHFER